MTPKKILGSGMSEFERLATYRAWALDLRSIIELDGDGWDDSFVSSTKVSVRDSPASVPKIRPIIGFGCRGAADVGLCLGLCAPLHLHA